MGNPEIQSGEVENLFCAQCNEIFPARYNGIQLDEKNQPMVRLYTCNMCHNTFAMPLQEGDK